MSQMLKQCAFLARSRPFLIPNSQFHASQTVLVGHGARPKKSPVMNWKRKRALQEKEKAYLATLGDSEGLNSYEGPKSLRPIDDDAKEISYDDLMGMLFNESKEETNPIEDKMAQKEEWRKSRKYVDVNALFAPR